MRDEEDATIENENIDEEVKTLMKDHDIDESTAEQAQELINEGLDEEEAIEIAENL